MHNGSPLTRQPPFDGQLYQGDTRKRPAAALMADYTMPLRGHGIITAERLLYRHMARAIRGRGPLPP
ncbi:hypothetical protein B5F10_01380 [Anaerotruncus colihominis]|uniref:Uncharacterized protein n=1 Tax=Anaerotruncus colihominis TaxID=169435 RepID=A0A1Y4N7K2_9FIRM|nr:hypothetical protein B5F55_02845 [Anaerotruncus colihominis]OUP70963.1 hypothetical protein B5F11_02525 [Anaerotruncus colihominis]OUP76510.1 hypothetical protein B5F10_01380 [Anaerotruncus colihominis]